MERQQPAQSSNQQRPQNTAAQRGHHGTEHHNQASRFRTLCAELQEYEHLPELTPSPGPRTRPLTDEGHAETLDETILAGLTLP